MILRQLSFPPTAAFTLTGYHSAAAYPPQLTPDIWERHAAYLHLLQTATLAKALLVRAPLQTYYADHHDLCLSGVLSTTADGQPLRHNVFSVPVVAYSFFTPENILAALQCCQRQPTPIPVGHSSLHLNRGLLRQLADTLVDVATIDPPENYFDGNLGRYLPHERIHSNSTARCRGLLQILQDAQPPLGRRAHEILRRVPSSNDLDQLKHLFHELLIRPTGLPACLAFNWLFDNYYPPGLSRAAKLHFVSRRIHALCQQSETATHVTLLNPFDTLAWLCPTASLLQLAQDHPGRD